MDTKLFDYLNNKKAKFEIRHYIIQGKSDNLDAYGLSRLGHKTEPIESHRS